MLLPDEPKGHLQPANIKSPLTQDLVASNGKGDAFYDVHPYHTKVPVSIVVSLIEHYTSTGDLILDPFCGSGSTGLAARITCRRFYLFDLSPYAIHIANGYTESCSASMIQTATEKLLKLLSEHRTLYYSRCHRCHETVEGSYWIWSNVFHCRNCRYKWTLSS